MSNGTQVDLADAYCQYRVASRKQGTDPFPIEVFLNLVFPLPLGLPGCWKTEEAESA